MLRKSATVLLALAAALLAAVPARAIVTCSGPNTYMVPAGFATISAAVAAIPPSLPGPWCVNITNSAVYIEQVDVRNFTNNGSSITIQAMPGQYPSVRPPLFTTAGFVIANASVNIQGIGVAIAQSMPYGVLVSSPFVSLSNVNVDGGANVTVAGVAISSFTTIDSSSVAVQNAYGLLVSGSTSSVSNSTITNVSASKEAVLFSAASWNTITRSSVSNTGSYHGMSMLEGANGNTVSLSTLTAAGSGASAFVISNSSYNLVDQSYLCGFAGSAASVLGAQASRNTISRSTMAADSGASDAMRLSSASTTTITQSFIFNRGGTALYIAPGTHYNSIVQSTMSGAGTGFGLHVVGSDSNTVTGSYVGAVSYGAFFQAGADFNAISFSTLAANNNAGLYIEASASNTVTNSFLRGSNYGAWLTGGSSHTFITLSTMTAASGYGLLINNASSNTASLSYIWGGNTGVQLNAGADYNTVSFSTITGAAMPGYHAVGADWNLLTRSVVAGVPRGVTLEGGSDFNAISFTAMTGNNAAGIQFSDSDWNTVTQSYMQSQNYGAEFLLGAENNAVSLSTMIGTSDVGFYVSGAASNTVTGSYLQGGNNGARLDGADYNVISFSTMSGTLYAGVLGLIADWNRVESSFILGASTGVWLHNNSDLNTISRTTVAVTGDRSAAIYMLGADSNTITNSYLHSANGPGVFLSTGADFNAITASSITATGMLFSDYPLHLVNASSNTITGSRIARESPGGLNGAYIDTESNGNSIVSSSITAGGAALTFDHTSSNTVVGSYLSGGSGLAVKGSTGTRVSASRLDSSIGYSLRMFGGSVGLSVTGSTATTGTGGYGLYSESFNGGVLEVLDSFVYGGACSVCIETTTVGSTLWIASNTFLPGPSATGFRSLALDGLLYGATIQNNNIYLRAAATGGAHRGMVFASSRGLLIERNRINQPGVLGIGSFTGVVFSSVTNSSFRFNDVHSSGTLTLDSYMLDFTASTVSVRNNVFMSSNTGGGMVAIKADSASGLPLDYNTYYSSNSALWLNWGSFSQSFPWSSGSGADRHSISGNPQWANTQAGAEDFHVKSVAGRFNPATQTFAADTVDSPTLDYADPDEPFALEPSPNGGRANPGSYGNTPQASKSSPAPCPVTLNICKTGFCPFQTIQSAVNFLPNPLTGHSCLHIQDAATYTEQVMVEGFVNNGSSITIRLDPALTNRPTVNAPGGTAAFVIRNSSVNLAGLNVSAMAAAAYGILVSSPNVSITSVNVVDSMSMIGTAGVVLSSYSTLSYSTVAVNQLNASGVRLEGKFALISYSSMTANSNTGSALLLNGVGSNTVTNSFIANGPGNGASFLSGAEGNSIIQSTMTSGSGAALLFMNAASNTVTGSYMGGGSGVGSPYGVALITGSNYNRISFSTMTAATSSGRALFIDGSSWNRVTDGVISNPVGYGVFLNDAHWNRVDRSTITGVMTGGFIDAAAFRLYSSSYNSLTGDYIQSSAGNGLGMDSNSNANDVAASTVVTANLNIALKVTSSSSNTFTGSRIFSAAGHGATFNANADYNRIVQSTVASGTLGYRSLWIFNSDRNSVTGSYLSHPNDIVVLLEAGADFNTVSQTTIAANSSAYALDIMGSSSNTVTGSWMSNPSGYAALISNAAGSTISLSTLTSAGASPTILLSGSTLDTISGCYVQGSTAVVIQGSTGTLISGSMLVGTAANGAALALQMTTGNVTVASTTLRGAAAGRALRIDPNNVGVVSLGSVTVTGSARGLEISTQAAGFVLAVDSITFRGMTAGATAIHFMSGSFTSSITLANFEDSTVGANVSAAALDAFPASRITMFAHYGVRTSTAHENDPSGYVFWEAGDYPGCVTTRNVGAGQPYATIQAGVNALPATLAGHSCVVVRDGGTYSEQVTIQGFVNNGSSITIMGDPASSTVAPRVAPPAASVAGFRIMNSSVNLAGIDVRTTGGGGVSYGISVSSTYVKISSVNVYDAMASIMTAGISLSSWTTVSYTSVTVSNAYGFLLPGSTMTTISYSSATNAGFGRAAVHLAGASSNTFTRVLAHNASGGGGLQIEGGGYNRVSLSSSSSTGSAGLFIDRSSYNTVSASYLGSSGSGYGLRLQDSTGNEISQSTAVAATGAIPALLLSFSSSNTITGVFASNPQGYGAYLANSSNNTVSFSTFTGATATDYGLYLFNSSSNSFAGSHFSNPGGPAAVFSNASSNTVSQSTFAGAAAGYSFELNGGGWNRIVGSRVLTGARLNGATNNNTITASTFTQNSAILHGLYLEDASSNTVASSFMSNATGNALRISGPGNTSYNSVSQSTITSETGTTALYLSGTGNTFVSDYIGNAGGYAAQLQGAAYSEITQSTIANNSAPSSALYLWSATSNTVARSVIVNRAGSAAVLETSANWNVFSQSVVRGGDSGIKVPSPLEGLTVVLSTVTGAGATGAGLYVNSVSSYISVSHSYVQGSTGVYLSGARRTSVNASVIAGDTAVAMGIGLYLTSGGQHLSMSSNTVLGGGLGGIAVDNNSSGSIALSTNTVITRGASHGVVVTDLNPAAVVSITSNTILPSLSASATTYGVFINNLPGGATVQNNGIFYRTAGAAFGGAGAGAYGLYAKGSSGLKIDHNRISNPSMVASGNYIALALSGTTGAMVKFNDLYSTGAGLTTFNLLRVDGSVNTVVRSNVLSSSMTTTLATNNRLVVVDLPSQAGYSSDYNTYFSSNSVYQGSWGGSGVSMLTNWISVTGKDANTLSGNPLWVNPSGEDFHPLSRGGRWTNGGFVVDAVSGPGLDRADPADAVADEQGPNGARANQGSYGQTAEASKSVLPCPLTLYVRQAGDGDSVTIQGAINSLPNPLTSHSCVVIGDSGIYAEQVTVQGFINNGSSITIMLDPSLTARPTVRSGFVIRNASVNVVGIDIATAAPAVGMNYGIFASSANINLSSVSVRDPGGFIFVAGVALSSYSSLSYSSISVQGAHGVRLDGKFAAVSYSTMASNSSGFSALSISGASSNTVTESYLSNPLGYTAQLNFGADYNTVSQSTIVSGAVNFVALYINNAKRNTVTGSYMEAADGFGALLSAGASFNTISFSTMISNELNHYALYLNNADSNTVTNSLMQNPPGYGAFLQSGSDNNTISLSTMISNAGGRSALYILESDSNTVTGSYIANPAGYGAHLASGADYNTIDQSVIESNGIPAAGSYALYLTAAATNTVTRSYIKNPLGYAALITNGASRNTISLSTITSGGINNAALILTGSSSNTVLSSYIQGSTAAVVSGSTGTVVNSSVLVATNTAGSALALQGGGRGLALSSNTIIGGSQGAGVYLDAFNAGAIVLSTNTVYGGRYGLYVATQQAATTLWITSNTIVPALAAGLATRGIYTNGLVSGATIQNNGIYYRSPGVTGAVYTAALEFFSSGGLVISGNRLSNPGMITGNALGVGLEKTLNTVFTFNDVHSTGTGIASAYHMRVTNSPGTQVRGNVFSSSWTVTASTAALFVDAASQAGFVSDYNAFFSSNSFNSIEWGVASLPFPWSAATGRDGNSLARHPRWKDVSPGVEDFHHLSQAGRWDGAGFVNDAYTSALIDAADPLEAFVNEAAPNGGRANLGSYGKTAEASKSPAPPAAPAVAAVFASSISVSYGLAGADGYVVGASTAADLTGTLFSSTTANGALALLAPQGLAANTTYFLRTAASWGDFLSISGVLLTTATRANPPGAAVPDFVGISTYGVTVNFTPNGNPLGSTYTVVLSSGSNYPNAFTGNVQLSTTSLAAPLTGLAPNTTYFAYGAGVNWNGMPSAYAVLGSTPTLAAAPLSVASTFSAVGFSSFSVSWSANANPLSITTYTVTVSTASDFNAFASSVTFSTAPASGPGATFTGLGANTIYFFRVRAVNQNGVPTGYTLLGSTETRPVTLQAPAIAGIAAVYASSITATWGLSALATGYTLVASLTNDPTAVFASSSPVGINATTATVFAPALNANTTYYLFVRATGPGAATSFSAFGATSTLAASPLSAVSTFSAVFPTSMTVSWLPGGNPLGVTTYTVVLSTGASYPNTFADNRIMASTAPAGAFPAASFTGLNDNTAYFLHVSAVNHNGVSGAFAALGSTVTRISAPTAVIFDEISSNTIVASAYAPLPGFNNLGAGQSGTRISKNAVPGTFHGEAWAAATSLPLGIRDAAAAGFNGKVYLFGGFSGAAAQSLARVYDPATALWTALASQPSARGGHAAAAVGGKVYAVGGTLDGFTSLNLNEEYDPVTNGWTAKASLGTRSNYLSAAGTGGAVYAFGGLTDGVDNSKTEQYDPATGAWTVRPDFPAARHQAAAGAAAGPTAGLIIAAGGSGPADGTYAYDTAANTWSGKSSMPFPAEEAAAASLGGKIYVVGGAPASQTVYEYDPAANLWTTRAAMTTGRARLSVTAAGGRLYAIGGTPDGGANSLLVNEEYDPGTATRFSGLLPNTQAGFRAQARNQAGTSSAESILFSTWTWAALPAAAAAPFAVVEADSITFSWALNGNPGTTEFKARASTAASFGGGAAVVSSEWSAMTSTAALALAPNTTYFFQSAARNGVGGVPGVQTAWVPLGSTATLAALPALAPASFAGAATNGLTVSWLPNGNPLSITTYTVVVSTQAGYPNSNAGNMTVASTFPAGALPTASLAGLVANTTYFAFVAAVNHHGLRTAYAALGSTATLALPPLAASPAFSAVSTSAVTFSWMPNGNPLNVTTYSVVLSTGGAFNSFSGNVAFSTAPAGASPTATTAAGLNPNTTYYGYAAAINSAGAVSAYASLGSTSTLAAAPETVVSTFAAVNISSLSVSWSAAGNPLSITTYTVQLSTAADFNAFASSVVFSTAPAAGPSATFTGLADYTQYFFRVRAVNHGGAATTFVNLGSTTTLVAPLGVPALAGFVSVDITSITSTWGLVTGATGYTLVASLLPANPPTAIAASSTTLSITATTAAALAPPLSPNTTYFLFVRANGPLRSSLFAAYGATSTLASVPATAVTTFTGVGITSFTVSWSANGNALAITTYTVQLSTAPDFNAFATSVTVTTTPAAALNALFTGLSGNTSYYLRIRALNHNGVPSAFVSLGSTLTVVSPLFPTIMDSQTGDVAWRRANTALYSVAFLDTSGAHLDKFQVKASTTAAGLGTDIAPWTDVIVGLSPSDSYSTPWLLPASVFTALLEGVTNYISVRAFNGAPLNNFTVLQDAFYVQKDTTSPVIVDAQSGDSVARATPGTAYSVGVRDPSSGLAAFEYSASLSPGTPDASLIGWTAIALVAGSTYYDAPWTVNFTALASGVTNYISVRSWDTAGATTTATDAFYVHKDTTGPSVAIAAPQNGAFHSALATLSGTAASIYGVQGTEVSLLDIGSGLYWNPAAAAFNSAAPILSTAVGGAAWTFSPGVAWVDGASYRAVARSSTTAGLYSTVYATASFIMDLSKPAVAVLSPAPNSTVSTLAQLSGTAADPAPNPSGLSSVEVRLRRNADGLWWNWFTQAWGPVAVSSITAGTTAWSLSPTPELKGNLDDGASYFIAVRASDNALPANQGDFFVSGATFTWQDSTPPSAVADLAAAHGTAPGSINLSWTAAGDDAGSGTIVLGEYRIFYSTELAATASTTAAQVVIATAGINPGDLQSYTLTGLSPGVTYYVSLALDDGEENWSLFSNQASTSAAPSPLNAITGHVVDISTLGITAVQVDCWNSADALMGTTFTLADGSGTFSVGSLPAGSYKLRVTWTVNGFSSSLWQDGIAMGSTNVDFFLEINYALATLTGTLGTLTSSSFGAGGLGTASAAADSFIELHQQGRQVARTSVQPTGRWAIPGLLPGSYSVRAFTGLGYTPFQEVTLAEGEVRVLGFVFNPLPEASVFAFPNPARTATTIRFETALAPLEAGIYIFDLAGNLVKEISDSQISRAAAPTYRAAWDLNNSSGRPVAPGVYHVMVKVKGGSEGQTAKVIKKLAVVR